MLWGLAAASRAAAAQVQVRVGEARRGTYSELHEALLADTPAAARILEITSATRPGPLWQRVRGALDGRGEWNDGLLALTRLAELPPGPYADSAAGLRKTILGGPVKAPPGRDPTDLVPPLDALLLMRARAKQGDAALLADLVGRVPEGRYGLAEAWVMGRLAGTTDTLQARFLSATDPQLKVRYLTLLGFCDDPAAIPLLARIYAAPDSFGVPPRFGARASDALLWIGTRSSLQALLDARERARALGSYADPALSRGGYEFLANDSSAVISRTGRWLTTWVETLPPE